MKPPTAAELQRAAVVAFAHALVIASLNRVLHARDSRFVTDSLDELTKALGLAAGLGVEMPLQLEISEDRLHFAGEPLDGPSLQARTLLRRCHERHIAAVVFSPNLGVDEANRCFDLLLLPQNVGAFARQHRRDALRVFGIRNVHFTSCSPSDPSDRRQAISGRAKALHQYQDLADCLQQNHVRAHRDLELGVNETAGVVERTVADFEEPSLLLSLAAQDNVDRFTVGHSVRVALLALQVARELGAPRDDLVHVGSAALMHDIGKSKVPQQVLFKQGRLSAEEWHWMAQHPRLGAQILLEQHEQVDPRAIGAAFCHHMGPSGRGYPEPAIPVAPSGISRLVRVCDVFEALTAVRPYKRALTPIEAYAVMFRNERDFDPAWLRCFARTVGLFPTGTRVQLVDGAEAMVIAQTKRPDQPTVQLLTGALGQALSPGQPERLTIGHLWEGTTARIAGVTTHDRCIAVPEFDPAEPDVLTQTASHACLSSTLLATAGGQPGKGTKL